MKNDRYTSLIWAAFGLYIAYEGHRLKLGDFNEPKSGFFVFWAGVVLLSLSLILFVQTVFRKEKGTEEFLWKGLRWRKGIKFMTLLFVYAMVFRWMGFLLSSCLLLLFLLKGLESLKWRTSLIISIITTAFCYLVFEVILESQFPSGFIGKLLE